MDDFYDELLEHRDAVRALLLAHGDPAAAEAVAEGQQHFSDLFRALTELAESWSARSEGMSGVFTDVLISRLIVGMLMLFTTFDWWFAPPGEPPVAKAQVIGHRCAGGSFRRGIDVHTGLLRGHPRFHSYVGNSSSPGPFQLRDHNRLASYAPGIAPIDPHRPVRTEAPARDRLDLGQ
jgi:hypothetical protein